MNAIPLKHPSQPERFPEKRRPTARMRTIERTRNKSLLLALVIKGRKNVTNVA